MEHIDAVVIGAGVVGLAVAAALAGRGLETVVLERTDAIGTGTSSRNSEVIHAGLYHPTGSLKARLCVRGREQLYAYCAARGVEHRRCGKLIVATEAAQAPQLARIEAQAVANGVHDLRWLDAAALRFLEPELSAVAALHSPSTGIVDSHGLMLALLGDVQSQGGALALRSPVVSVRHAADGHVLQVGGDAPMELHTRWLVNAAGLWAHGLVPDAPRLRFAKGSYFALSGRAPFRHLVYPVPQDGGLGVHLTLDLAGQARFGPDVQWLDVDTPEAIDYRVDEARKPLFEAEIRRYWPGLPAGALHAAYSGVRPKLSGPGEPAADFLLQGPADPGVAGCVHLLGIESPGLTASLAIADEVLARLGV